MPKEKKEQPKKGPAYPGLRIDMSVWEEEGSLLLLRGWKRDGYTDAQIAKLIGISPQTLCAWKSRSPLILEALKKSRDEWHRELEEAMYKRCFGFTVDEGQEEIREVEGQPTIHITRKYRKYIPPSETMQIFVAKHDIRGHWLDDKTIKDQKEQDERIARMQREAEKADDTNEIHITIEGADYAE